MDESLFSVNERRMAVSYVPITRSKIGISVRQKTFPPYLCGAKYEAYEPGGTLSSLYFQ